MLLLGAEPHHVLDAGPVVPAAIEDHDLAGGGEVLHVPLHVDLGLLAIGRRRQGHDPEDPRADPLGDRADGAPFPAPSRPSKTTTTRSPFSFTQACR